MADEEFIDCKCPYCTGAVSFPADTPGKIQECPECAETLILPQASSEFGMRREGEFLKDRFLKGQWADTVWMAMLSDEYARARSSPPPRSPA